MRAALVIAAMALAGHGCGDRCPRGPTTTCWCRGDVIGESTCGEDGRYGACACPGVSGAPAPSTGAVPVPSPPPPPPTQRPVLMPVPSAPSPPATGPSASRDATIAAWVAGPVRGHDNRMAAMRRVTIRGTEGAYAITIDNQFGFRCDLDFDVEGHPSALRDCRSPEPEWHASPDVIAVTCTRDGPEIECQAPYSLRAEDGYASREIILFRRSE